MTDWTPEQRAHARRRGEEGARIALMPGVIACIVPNCGKRLEGRQRLYCGAEHRLRAKQLRQMGRGDELGDGLTVRGDTTRDAGISDELAEEWLRLSEAGWTNLQIAKRDGYDPSTVNRRINKLLETRRLDTVRAGWEPPERNFPRDHWDLDESHLDALVTDFLWLRGEFFRTPRGKAYWTPSFQEKWVRAVIRTLVTGGRQVILSPVRHGKTELLIHVSVWLIARFPNIRIVWVGGNEKLAQKSVRHVARHLSNNEDLVKAFAGPGKTFKPKSREGVSWSASDFTVATRTTEIKGSTMVALGRGGTLASLDADIIIADDIEDHKATVQPGSRENTRDWWTSDFESRKEEHTGLFVIGSRSHIDDLNGHLLENSEYEAIVETAHDPICEIPQDDPELYDSHQECMLFPELRSFRWLMSQKRASEAGGGIARFNMVYLNQASGKGLTIFVATEIAACRDRQWRVPGKGGAMPSPLRPNDAEAGGIRLIAGLDPSGSGYQAAFLWAYQVRPELHMWMVDTENQEGGGIAQARKTITDWWEAYRVSHWVIEENLYHGGITEDEKLTEIRQALSIKVEPHHTGHNKWDPTLGVSTLAPLFRAKTITLPYGDPDSVAKSDAYQRQLVHFSDAPRNRNTRAGYKSDLVMASWFPMVVIRREQTEFIAEMGVDYSPEYGNFTGYDWNEAPWETSQIA